MRLGLLGERQMKTYRFDSQNQQQKRRGRAAAQSRLKSRAITHEPN